MSETVPEELPGDDSQEETEPEPVEFSDELEDDEGTDEVLPEDEAELAAEEDPE